jgi:hypothetical protein
LEFDGLILRSARYAMSNLQLTKRVIFWHIHKPQSIKAFKVFKTKPEPCTLLVLTDHTFTTKTTEALAPSVERIKIWTMMPKGTRAYYMLTEIMHLWTMMPKGTGAYYMLTEIMHRGDKKINRGFTLL